VGQQLEKTMPPETQNGGTFVSIQLNSNRPSQIRRFLENVQDTASKPHQIEVLIHIDQGDDEMVRVLELAKRELLVSLKILATDMVRNFFDLWKPLNELIKLTDPDAYFVMNVSDEFMFETKGWDDILRDYVGYFPDHIFRVRASQFRFRNYIDVWECGFAPDSLAFYTKRWFEITGDWNPCMGPDSFQQCVSFYLFTDDAFQMRQTNRDIADPFLKFSGEGANIGLSEEALSKRTRGHFREWFQLMSHPMQTEAKKRAMLLKAHIFAEQKGLMNGKVTVCPKRKMVTFTEDWTNRQFRFSYKLSRIKSTFQNFFRRVRYPYYAGGGKSSITSSYLKGFIFLISYSFPSSNVYETWFGRSINNYIHRKTLLRTLKGIKRRRARIRNLYLYGSGQYADQVVRMMKKLNLQGPELIIEEDNILQGKGKEFLFHNQVVEPQSKALPKLTTDDAILIGSFSYSNEIIERLKKAKCAAKIVDLTF